MRPLATAQYRASLFAIALGIFALCQIDAGLTLILLDTGTIEEKNPLMAILIAQDVRLFVAVKSLVTGLCIVLAVAASNRYHSKYLVPETTLRVLLEMYLCLVAYELLLLSLVPQSAP